MKYFYTLLLITAISFNLHAQRNFKPGYIVTLSGDTARGFVDYKEWDLNPRNITFSINGQTAKTAIYTMADIKAFGVNNLETYRVYNLAISKNSIETSKLSSFIDTSFATDNVFLRVAATGKNVTLFQYTDDIKDRFYIAQGTSAPVELKYYRYLDEGQLNKVITVKAFGQQLQRLVAIYQPGNRALVAQVQRAEYRADDIIKIAFAINGSEKAQKLKVDNRTATIFFVGIAANATHTTYSDYETTSNTSVFPQLNAGFNFFFNKNVRQLLFRTELNITGNKSAASRSLYTFSGPVVEQLSFDQFTASLVPQLIYNVYNTDEVKAFLGIGMPVNVSTYSNLKYFVGSSQREYSSPSKTYISIAGKAGATLKKFEVYIAYNKPLSDFVGLGIIRHSYQLGINYFF